MRLFTFLLQSTVLNSSSGQWTGFIAVRKLELRKRLHTEWRIILLKSCVSRTLGDFRFQPERAAKHNISVCEVGKVKSVVHQFIVKW